MFCSVPLVLSTFGILGPAAEGYLQKSASVACSTGFVDRGAWLRISRQYLSCALVRLVVLYFVTTTAALLNVLALTYVMVLLCHANDFGFY